MFKLRSLLTEERCLCKALGVSKKRIFETASAFICDNSTGFDNSEVYNNLLARERLGSTALGEGIAIPHCRVSHCKDAIGALITLEDGVDFDAPDNAPVDIIFVLLVPEEAQQEHLNILAGLAQLLGNEDFCSALRAATTPGELYRAAVEFQI